MGTHLVDGRSMGAVHTVRLRDVFSGADQLVSGVHGLSPVVGVLSLHTNVLDHGGLLVAVVVREIEGDRLDIRERLQHGSKLHKALFVDRQIEKLCMVKSLDAGEVHVLVIDIAFQSRGVVPFFLSTDHHQLPNVNRRCKASNNDYLSVRIADQLRLRVESVSEGLEYSNSIFGFGYVQGSGGLFEHGVQVPVVVRELRVMTVRRSEKSRTVRRHCEVRYK